MRLGSQPEFDRTPYLDSILPRAAQAELERGILPLLRCDNLALEEGEYCHYADCAIYEKKIRRPRAASRRQNAGIFRSRRRDMVTVKDAVVDIAFEQIDGCLYITNDRVLFSGGDEFWDRNIRELLAVKPYLNCVKFQFGKDSYKVFVPDGNLPALTLNLVRQLLKLA